MSYTPVTFADPLTLRSVWWFRLGRGYGSVTYSLWLIWIVSALVESCMANVLYSCSLVDPITLRSVWWFLLGRGCGSVTYSLLLIQREWWFMSRSYEVPPLFGVAGKSEIHLCFLLQSIDVALMTFATANRVLQSQWSHHYKQRVKSWCRSALEWYMILVVCVTSCRL
jgi:hypothetical protein